jgi:ribulose-bisphosphate carboxylase large chain
MIDIVCTGISAIQILRDDPSIRVPIYCHRAGHAAFTENPKHGIHWKVYCKLARLLGADVIHAGTVVGKMRGEREEVLDCYNVLRNEWCGFKSTMPAASGGLHPSLAPELIKLLGKDVIANFGGGIHGHPNGTRAGAEAVRQAIDAATNNIKLKEYAKSHRELKIALERWK